MTQEDIFISILKQNIDDLKALRLPKGKLVGKYIQELNAIDKENSFRYKLPQITWFDYIQALSDEEYNYFKMAFTND